MIDLDEPKSEAIPILPRQAVRKTRGRRDLQVIQNYNRASRRLIEGQKQGMLALCGVWRAVDKDQLCALQAQKRLALRGHIKRLNRSKPIPAPRQRYDLRKIAFPLRDRVGLSFGSRQPIGGILNAGGSSRGAAERVG